MPVKSGRVTVGTAATPIPESCIMPWRLEIKNDDNVDTVYIGNGDVSTATGLRLDKGERVSLTLAPNDRIYCVSTKEGHTVSYIRFSQGC
jgi:DNA-binding beta-propeller fold protein YncE